MKDPSDRKVRPRPTCRFFMKGNCLREGPLRGPLVWSQLFPGQRWWFSPGPGQGCPQGRSDRLWRWQRQSFALSCGPFLVTLVPCSEGSQPACFTLGSSPFTQHRPMSPL